MMDPDLKHTLLKDIAEIRRLMMHAMPSAAPAPQKRVLHLF